MSETLSKPAMLYRDRLGANQFPAHQGQLTARLLRILADDGDGLSRGDVVAGSPLFFARNAVEIFFDKLFSPGKSVAPAHGGYYGRWGSASAN
jgi:hypothetical protein